jgi:hypothetical protein
MEERPPVCKVAANTRISSSGQQPSSDLPAWGLGDIPTSSHLKIGLVTKRIHVPRAWTDPLVRFSQWKMDMRFGT